MFEGIREIKNFCKQINNVINFLRVRTPGTAFGRCSPYVQVGYCIPSICGRIEDGVLPRGC